MLKIIFIFQILIPLLLIVFILLQERGTALGAGFGGGGEVYLKKRGVEKKIFLATVVLAILFVLISVLNLVIA